MPNKTSNGHPHTDELLNRINELSGGNAYAANCSIALGKVAVACTIWQLDVRSA